MNKLDFIVVVVCILNKCLRGFYGYETFLRCTLSTWRSNTSRACRRGWLRRYFSKFIDFERPWTTTPHPPQHLRWRIRAQQFHFLALRFFFSRKRRVCSFRFCFYRSTFRRVSCCSITALAAQGAAFYSSKTTRHSSSNYSFHRPDGSGGNWSRTCTFANQKNLFRPYDLLEWYTYPV